MFQMISPYFWGRVLPLRPGLRFWLFTYFDSRLVVAQNDTRRSERCWLPGLLMGGQLENNFRSLMFVIYWDRCCFFSFSAPTISYIVAYESHSHAFIFISHSNPMIIVKLIPCLDISIMVSSWIPWLTDSISSAIIKWCIWPDSGFPPLQQSWAEEAEIPRYV